MAYAARSSASGNRLRGMGRNFHDVRGAREFMHGRFDGLLLHRTTRLCQFSAIAPPHGSRLTNRPACATQPVSDNEVALSFSASGPFHTRHAAPRGALIGMRDVTAAKLHFGLQSRFP